MANKKIIKRNSGSLTYKMPFMEKVNENTNKYDVGGILAKFNTNLGNVMGGNKLVGTPAGSAINVLGSTAGQLGGTLIGGDLESNVGSAVTSVGGALGTAAGAVNPLLGGIISAGTGILGGLTTRAFGSKLNNNEINKIKASNLAMNQLQVDGSSNDAVMSQWDSVNFGENFTRGDIGKDGWFSNKAHNKYNTLKQEQDAARGRALLALSNGANNADSNLDMSAFSNYAALGGPINIASSMPMSPFGNRFDEGGPIHINPDNKGKFNRTKQRTGKSTEELTHSKNALTRKRAIFAQNASHWHDLGGVLQGNGADWPTGMTFINNGGTHEQNPNEGIQMGIDDQGTPNLVEQGEVKWNNYIFSNRMAIKESLLEKANLPTSLANHTFASAAESLGKESKERPNDPISQKGLNSMLGRLAAIQEIVRQKEQSKQSKQQAQIKNNNKYEGGGPLRDNYSNQSFFRSYYSDNAIDNPLQNNLDSPLLPTVDKTSSNQGLADLRYVPAIGSGLSALSDTLGLTNTPDYSNADLILKAGNNLKNVSYTPIGNYLTYTPLDRNFYTNKLQAQANATRRAIIDQSGGNRVNAVAGMLAADYNAQSKLGDLFRQAEEYNQGLKERVQTFNRGTNQFNSEASLKAQMANQANDRIRYEAAVQAAKVREEEDARIAAQRSANLSNFLQNMGDIVVDAYNRNDRNALIKSGYFGALNTAMLQNSSMSRTDKINYLKSLGWTDEEVKKAGFAYGGKLKIKKRGLTY